MTTMLSEFRNAGRSHGGPGIFSDTHWGALSDRFTQKATLGPAGGERMFAGVLKAIEIVGVAGAMSYMNSKHAPVGKNAYELFGVPADLALGLLFSGFALTGYFGQQGDHALNFGIGFLGAYACRMGSIWGAASRELPHVVPAPMPLPAPHAVPAPQEGAKVYPWAA